VSEPTLNWSSAAVADGELVVGIEGELPKGWKAAFEATAQMLGHGDWKATVKKGLVHVGGVRPGDEDRLRHFLEGAVQQANADAPEPEDDDAHDEDAAESDSESDTPSESATDPDAEMTERFRSFSGGG
jgi:hypothetical protein